MDTSIENLDDRAVWHKEADGLSVYLDREVFTLFIFRHMQKAAWNEHIELMRKILGKTISAPVKRSVF